MDGTKASPDFGVKIEDVQETRFAYSQALLQQGCHARSMQLAAVAVVGVLLE